MKAPIPPPEYVLIGSVLAVLSIAQLLDGANVAITAIGVMTTAFLWKRVR